MKVHIRFLPFPEFQDCLELQELILSILAQFNVLRCAVQHCCPSVRGPLSLCCLPEQRDS